MPVANLHAHVASTGPYVGIQCFGEEAIFNLVLWTKFVLYTKPFSSQTYFGGNPEFTLATQDHVVVQPCARCGSR